MIKADDVVSRLKDFGYEFAEGDAQIIRWLIGKVEQDIMNYCNLPEVPEELRYRATDAVVGEFLGDKLVNGELPSLERIAQAVKSISEGDVQISYGDNMNYEQYMLSVLEALKLNNNDLNAFRRIKW